ncbi:MAG: hypothetical protein KC561_04535 [Myxococcales bacterium]|nr:hypothetical protein [Myxococcales bacterium]
MRYRVFVPITLVLCTGLFGAATPARAQAWIEEPGSGYLQPSYRRISGDAFYDGDGEAQDLPSTYTQQTLSLYGQFGILPRWLQLTVSGELYRHNELEDQGATFGLGDLRVGLWTGLLQGAHNLSFGLWLGIPSGDDSPQGPEGDLEGQGIARSLPTGDGETDVTPTLAYGTAFGGGGWPLLHYVSASVGYQVRSQGLQSALEYGLSFGTSAPYPVVERIWLVFALNGRESLGGSSTSGSFAGLGDGVSYTGLAVGLDVSIWNGLGVTARLEIAVRATNVISGGPLSVGLFWDF